MNTISRPNACKCIFKNAHKWDEIHFFPPFEIFFLGYVHNILNILKYATSQTYCKSDVNLFMCMFLPQLIQCVIKIALCLWKRLALSGTVSVSSSSCYRGESSSVFTFCTYLQIFKHQRDRPLGKCAPCWAHQKGQLGRLFYALHSVRCEKWINLTYDSRLLLSYSLNMV